MGNSENSDMRFTATFSDDKGEKDFKVGLDNVMQKDGIKTSIEYDVLRKDVEAMIDSEIGSFSYSTDKKSKVSIDIPMKTTKG